MNKKIALLRNCFLLLTAIIFLSSCAYSKVILPLDTDVNNTELGTKVGYASNKSILWLFAWGDAGTAAAARNGDIKVIKHLDLEQQIYLFGVYSKYTTIAYGD